MLLVVSPASHSIPPYPRDPLHSTFAMASATATATPILSHRPKLRLDTQSNRSFGKNSTSLRLDTLSAVSPTVRNTFSNAYEPPTSTSHYPTTRPRLSIDSSCGSLSSASTPSSASTLASSLTSASTPFPYKQPHNVTSILRNSQAPIIATRKMASARPFFPTQKRVSFRTPLEEEIKTVKYTMAHSDLESSCSTISSLASTSSSGSETASDAAASIEITPAPEDASSPAKPSMHSRFLSLENSPRPGGARAGDKRDSSESDSDSCPETPVAGRRLSKRRRDWRWTLGPLPSTQKPAPSSSSSSGSEQDSS